MLDGKKTKDPLNLLTSNFIFLLYLKRYLMISQENINPFLSRRWEVFHSERMKFLSLLVMIF
jgi:hypothetical protein